EARAHKERIGSTGREVALCDYKDRTRRIRWSPSNDQGHCHRPRYLNGRFGPESSVQIGLARGSIMSLTLRQSCAFVLDKPTDCMSTKATYQMKIWYYVHAAQEGITASELMRKVLAEYICVQEQRRQPSQPTQPRPPRRWYERIPDPRYQRLADTYISAGLE